MRKILFLLIPLLLFSVLLYLFAFPIETGWGWLDDEVLYPVHNYIYHHYDDRADALEKDLNDGEVAFSKDNLLKLYSDKQKAEYYSNGSREEDYRLNGETIKSLTRDYSPLEWELINNGLHEGIIYGSYGSSYKDVKYNFTRSPYKELLEKLSMDSGANLSDKLLRLLGRGVEEEFPEWIFGNWRNNVEGITTTLQIMPDRTARLSFYDFTGRIQTQYNSGHLGGGEFNSVSISKVDGEEYLYIGNKGEKITASLYVDRNRKLLLSLSDKTPFEHQFSYEKQAHINAEDAGLKPIDLGLSVMWGSCNLGAQYPDDYGDYYSWGESCAKEYYSEDNYNYDSIDKYSWEGLHLPEGWRIPTVQEFQELIDNCYSSINLINGTYGYEFRSNGRSVFFPFAGVINEYWVGGVEKSGYYLANDNGGFLSINADKCVVTPKDISLLRSLGRSIRLVKDYDEGVILEAVRARAVEIYTEIINNHPNADHYSVPSYLSHDYMAVYGPNRTNVPERYNHLLFQAPVGIFVTYSGPEKEESGKYTMSFNYYTDRTKNIPICEIRAVLIKEKGDWYLDNTLIRLTEENQWYNVKETLQP